MARGMACLVVCAVLVPALPAAEPTVVVDGDAQWRYLSGSGVPPRFWYDQRCDDASWPVGSGSFGSAPQVGTEIREQADTGAKLYLRRWFPVPEPGAVQGLVLSVASDGPFTVYLNGRKVVSSPEPLPYSFDPRGGRPVGFPLDLGGVAPELLASTNLLAIEVAGGRSPTQGFLFSCTLQVVAGETGPQHGAVGGSTAPSRPQRSLRSRAVVPQQPAGDSRYLILMICDGCGALQAEAANRFTGTVPEYQTDPAWQHLWMSTYGHGGGYDPSRAWSEAGYALIQPTDSAAAATAMTTGVKTSNGRVSVDADSTGRLQAISEVARARGIPVGALTTVPVSHATPGAFTSHNESRQNTFAIAAEAFFGDPNATGTQESDPRYGGSFQPTWPPVDLVIGDRSPAYLDIQIRDKLFAERGLPGKHTLLEGAPGMDFGEALQEVTSQPGCLRLAALFDRVALQATAWDNGYEPEAPGLAESTVAALTVLERRGNGFVLLIEGGAVDWAAHANIMDWMIGEMLDFSLAVQTVVDWVSSPANGSSWSNTLVIITGDHETGYLTRAPGLLPDQPLGELSSVRLGLEKIDLSTGRRASWLDDAPANGRIDSGETVYWAWGTGGHSNILIPVHARGRAAGRLSELAVASDPVRGSYLDNTDLFTVLEDAMLSLFADGFESGDTGQWSATVQ